MASPQYQAFLFAPGPEPPALPEAVRRAKATLPGFSARRNGSSVVFEKGGWALCLAVSNAPHVLQESSELARRHPEWPQAHQIAACASRIEVWSPPLAEDPDMEHLNDYILVVEALQSFPGVIAYDPASDQLI
jgi:hypothetical protein